MAASSSSSVNTESIGPSPPGAGIGNEPADPRSAFRSALTRYATAKLGEIVMARGLVIDGSRPSTMAAGLTEQLDSPSVVSAHVAKLGTGARTALSLYALTET